MSSRWIRSSSSTSPSISTISVRRGVANSVLMAVSSPLIRSTMRAREERIVEELLDLLAQLLQLVADLVAAERGEPLQPEVEDGARLLVGEADRALGRDLVARVGDQLDQRPDILGRPVAAHHLLAGLRRARRGADETDHLVDVGDRHRKPHQHVRPIPRLGEQELGAPAHHLLAVGGERADHVLEVELLGPAAVDRQHVGAEVRLQVRVAPELVQHHVGDRIAPELDDDAHAFPVRFVPDRRTRLRTPCRVSAR